MKVYKMEVFVIDFDEVGKEVVRSILVNARFPNRCIMPYVGEIQTREVEWSDSCDLNRIDLRKEAFQTLFR